METTIEKMIYGSAEWQAEIDEHCKDIDDNPTLYVGTYGKYNAGSLQGAWVNLSTFGDAHEFTMWCEDVLHCNEDDPELMFQDFMNFPKALYSESASDEELQRIWDWMDYDDDEREIIEEYWDEVDSRTDPDTILERHAYKGDFSDYAYMIAEEEMNAWGVGDWVSSYFDYKAFERDLQYDYNVTSNHVFYNY